VSAPRVTGKRVLDVVGATVGLVVASPILLLTAALIRLWDGDPVLFCQTRIGQGRRPFLIIKLRTMRGGRVTPLGAVLRNLGLDELPQLVNVLAGEMSLVGPRPLTRADVARIGWEDERFAMRWSVRPGLTGLAQLAPVHRCTARASWLLDRAYVRRGGVAFDLRLLAASALVPVLGKRRLRRTVRFLARRPA
jgi:lipopolysaccharide/colanic/teichoic acid biosynthesis glycosyltransferase